ncbi:ParB N-terminal domain-containing protein [Brevibacillus sp. HD3.3A]|uniref:ParB N-terminal domain-containing protein n=1 Tax=Brevibacillus sp. HD3.3A TaxID=2738979 RepID=UPI00156B3201|nr:ParB N-terminal domain-containing protein [Brevibacillus sp. HD3.3A]UED70717.1 ParB N-terminal domain-containing protein [Brevibacillus sp. HD3.3A]
MTMTTYFDIKNYAGINPVEETKVQELVASMLENGWQGAPILYVEDTGLVTGSHRLEALKRLEKMYDNADEETQSRIDEILSAQIALDVTEIINSFCEENACSYDEIDFSSLRSIFEGTEVEQYAAELAEW